jgi:hypothetical protein
VDLAKDNRALRDMFKREDFHGHTCSDLATDDDIRHLLTAAGLFFTGSGQPPPPSSRHPPRNDHDEIVNHVLAVVLGNDSGHDSTSWCTLL